MKKFYASIAKEVQLLIHDKVGLLLLYLMPILLVFIITIVQDSAFKLVNENRLDLLVSNHDEGEFGQKFVAIIEKSGHFNVAKDDQISLEDIQQETLDKKKMASIYIPKGFSESLETQANSKTKRMLKEFGINDDSTEIKVNSAVLNFYYDPIVQDNFRLTLVTNIQTILDGMENDLLVNDLFSEMGYDSIPEEIADKLRSKSVELVAQPASTGKNASGAIPNSTQHNVPAWSIFAMFFMVISLGGNLVKERVSGSFVRLLTIPPSFPLTILGKIVVFLFVALSQLFLLFAIGAWIFPLIGLPPLNIPDTILQLIVISIFSALAAISYAIMVGTFAKTQEQANGFGAISIVMLAAIGGIWVPTFVMPDYMLTVAKISPLYWCLEGYYSIFLKNGDWLELSKSIIYLFMFTFVCQLATYIKLKIQNFI